MLEAAAIMHDQINRDHTHLLLNRRRSRSHTVQEIVGYFASVLGHVDMLAQRLGISWPRSSCWLQSRSHRSTSCVTLLQAASAKAPAGRRVVAAIANQPFLFECQPRSLAKLKLLSTKQSASCHCIWSSSCLAGSEAGDCRER
jgi:hypothetical protein